MHLVRCCLICCGRGEFMRAVPELNVASDPCNPRVPCNIVLSPIQPSYTHHLTPLLCDSLAFIEPWLPKSEADKSPVSVSERLESSRMLRPEPVLRLTHPLSGIYLSTCPCLGRKGRLAITLQIQRPATRARPTHHDLHRTRSRQDSGRRRRPEITQPSAIGAT